MRKALLVTGLILAILPLAIPAGADCINGCIAQYNLTTSPSDCRLGTDCEYWAWQVEANCIESCGLPIDNVVASPGPQKFHWHVAKAPAAAAKSPR
jgi:hypothetical protein